MKIKINPSILPFFTLGAGGLGLCLQLWLLSTMDEQGLLAAGHPAGALSIALFAVVMGVLFLCTRQLAPVAKYNQLFPADLWGALGCAAGAAGILVSLFNRPVEINIVWIFLLISGVAAIGCFLFTGYCRFRGQHPSFIFHCVITVYFMFHLIGQCRTWCAEPQLHLCFFPFLSCVFLMLSSYHRTALDAVQGQRQWYVFFNQAAVFCCLTAASGSDKLFYLTMAVWASTNLCALQTRQRRSIPHQEEA